MKVLLFGAAGQLGTDLRRALAGLGEVVGVARRVQPGAGIAQALDIGDVKAVERMIESCAPDIVVNAAAYTAVDRAETERDVCFQVNAAAPTVMARACRRTGARLVHYSTDYVFDGDASVPYVETAPVAPQGVYGASKVAGEDGILASGCDALVIRAAWVYALHGHNFLRTMLKLASERDELRVVADQTGCPTPAWLIADTTARLLETAAPAGVYHLVTRGRTTWHGFAEAIVDEAIARRMLGRRPRVIAITTADYPTPAKRPAFSVLDTSRVEAAIGEAMPEWREALAQTFDRVGAMHGRR